MREKLFNTIWGCGVYFLHLCKLMGLSSCIEGPITTLAKFLFPLPQMETRVLLPFNMHMTIPPGFRRARSYLLNMYEKEVTNLFRTLVHEGMTVVDIGAFCGYYTLLASHHTGTKGRVYAFEPHPQNYSYMLQNVKENDCNNVIPIAKAVSNDGGNISLVQDREADHHWISYNPSGNVVNVPRISLDEFFAKEGWPPVDLVKMDIEGSEKAALEGMKELSDRNSGMRLIMEYALDNIRRAQTSPEALADILQDLGFEYGYIIERGMKPFSISSGLPETRAVYNLLLKKD